MEQLAAKAFTHSRPRGWWANATANRVASVPIFPATSAERHGQGQLRGDSEGARCRADSRRRWSRLTPIPADEVDAIQRLLCSGVPVLPHVYFHHGDRVRVVEGPLVGIEGLFVREQPTKGRLVLSINLLQASVAVEIDAACVEACRPRHAM
jgi:hypothetical protein